MKEIPAKTFAIHFQKKNQTPHLKHTIQVKSLNYFFVLYTFDTFQRFSIMVYT